MTQQYDAEHIKVLEGLEAVRKRPGMYIGTTGINGLNHLIYEVVDNSIDEALAGFCTDVSVVLHKNGSLTVTDNGPGMSREVRDKIFEPFFTTKPAGSGTGLGLSLSYEIITQGHGGTLSVASEEGKGASFTLTLPMK